jgi:presequence protease
VLCGSRRYPVRDPFFSMLRRSLNTFMNALTASDWTLYPFASLNEKDFYNLMGIYLDAVFFPLLSEQNFRQEGHRLEFADPENPTSPLEFKGVVYNEMKGAMADPASLIGRRLNRHLFPTTTYHHNSGGDPADILNLTHQNLKDFHSAYYHPSNAWFFSYGNLPLDKHLEAIQEQALQEFQARQVNSEVSPEQRYTAPRRAEETFPLAADEPQSRRSMVQVAWLTCDIADSFERTRPGSAVGSAARQPGGAPVQGVARFAPGHQSGAGFRLPRRLPHHPVRRRPAGHRSRTERGDRGGRCFDTLAEVARKAVSRGSASRAPFTAYEFGHREVTGDSYPYPLLLCMRMLGPWMHCGDAVSGAADRELNLERLAQGAGRRPFL